MHLSTLHDNSHRLQTFYNVDHIYPAFSDFYTQLARKFYWVAFHSVRNIIMHLHNHDQPYKLLWILLYWILMYSHSLWNWVLIFLLQCISSIGSVSICQVWSTVKSCILLKTYPYLLRILIIHDFCFKFLPHNIEDFLWALCIWQGTRGFFCFEVCQYCLIFLVELNLKNIS